MKAVILAGGLGSRMRSRDPEIDLSADAEKAAQSGLKWMIPLEGRPLISHTFIQLSRAGFFEICVVIGPNSEFVKEAIVGAAASENLKLSFVVQPEPLGTANAILPAEEFVGDDAFITLNGDTVYPASALERLASSSRDGWSLLGFSIRGIAEKSNIEEARARRFAALDFDSEFVLQDIVEDADDPQSYAHDGDLFVSFNCNRLDRRFFEACRSISPDPRNGEYQLPDAIRHGVKNLEIETKVVPVHCGVVDLTSRSSIESAAALLRENSYA
ncbi:MAG: NTP transferase domain-containing protein [Planctomycetota bacterium]|jgi:glucose-1-phosphate thymidylyltransferase|nr:NTP transferase domain-containing protein [Planctomycetota bacterium]MDP7248316.1 NTP transferase domain-containing protein [Planctomycetota bacterium]